MSLSKLLNPASLDLSAAVLRFLAGSQLGVRHARGGSLERHLLGTRRILAAWKQSTALQRAGLCHSLYSTESFTHAALALADRQRVRSVIGTEAEYLVYLFGAIRRASLFRSVSRSNSLGEDDQIAVETREGFHAPSHVSGQLAKQLLIIHLANMAEQAGVGSYGEGRWLAAFGGICRLLLERAPDGLPPVLCSCSGVSYHSEERATSLYLASIDRNVDPSLAISQLEEVSLLLPAIAEPHVWLARIHHRRGECGQGFDQSDLAIKKLSAFGTCWDKRWEYHDLLEIAKIGKHKSPRALFYSRLDKSAESPHKVEPNASDHSSTINEESHRIVRYLLDSESHKAPGGSSYFPGLRDDAFWSPNQFPLCSVLVDNAAAIKKEVDGLGTVGFHDEAERIHRSGRWQVLMLLEAGLWNETNLVCLPTLASILKQHNEVKVAGGLVYLSRLAPGTIVAPHRGTTNMRLRLHFALQVPVGDCGLKVNGQSVQWKSDNCLVFNDYLTHEVWNRTAEERLVLLVDIWHPDLSASERRILETIHFMVERRAQRLLEYRAQNEMARQRQESATTPLKSIDDLVF